MCGGGGSSSPTTTTVQQQSIPQELMPFATQLLGKAQDLTSQTYQPYTGQQVADINPLQSQAYQNTGAMQASPYTDQAASFAGMAGTNQFTGANVGQYMSPYMQNVVDQQQQGAIRDYARQLPQMAGMAAGYGGLGGSRQAIVQGEATRNLQNQLANIQATGSQNAFQNAQNQFNTANQNMLSASQQLGNMGNQSFNQNLGVANAQLTAGNALQQQQQNLLNSSMQNFYNQQNFPYQQLGFMSGLVRGTPTSQGTSAVYQAPMSPLQMGLGAATTIAGLGKKKGGQIRAEDAGLAGLFKAD